MIMKAAIISILSFAAAGCDGQEVARPFYGESRFLLNGELWATSERTGMGASSVGDDALYLFTSSRISSPDGYTSNGISIMLPDIVAGSYPAQQYVVGQALYGVVFREIDYDVRIGRWESIDPSDSVFVTRFDPATNEVEGTFEGTFVAPPRPDLPRTLPDTLRITDGYFRAIVQRPSQGP